MFFGSLSGQDSARHLGKQQFSLNSLLHSLKISAFVQDFAESQIESARSVWDEDIRRDQHSLQGMQLF